MIEKRNRSWVQRLSVRNNNQPWRELPTISYLLEEKLKERSSNWKRYKDQE
jgi:hypothetical protein